MKFIDEAQVKVFAGHGGSGFVGWRREKFVPMGGPDGGDGGGGGSVVFIADSGLNSLHEFALNPLIRARDGGGGARNQQSGRAGDDIARKVPVGTQVCYHDQVVADLSAPGARWIAARGGRGGKGNAFFKSSTNQAPMYAQPGQAGEIFDFRLVLKSVADVGFIGLPNAGKSTLISRISAATPKIADYPFTTLQPSLGVVALDGAREFVVADIPGLIPGAHQGKGLGIRFLKHIERTAVLLHFIDVTTGWENFDPPQNDDPAVLGQYAVEQYQLIDRELEMFSSSLKTYPRVVVFSKADLPVSRIAFESSRQVFEQRGLAVHLISSVSGEGLAELNNSLFEIVSQYRASLPKPEAINA